MADWIVLDADDAQAFMAGVVVTAANEQNEAGRKRLEKILEVIAEDIRGAIVAGGKVALSLTAHAIPPEGEKHAWALAIDMLVNASPQLGEYAISEKFGWTIKEARDWVQKLREGLVVQGPEDPDEDATPPGVQWGDDQGTSAEGTAGRLDMTT